jgi:hypothetical protein
VKTGALVELVRRDKRFRYAAAGLAAALVITAVAFAAVGGTGSAGHTNVVSDAGSSTTTTTTTTTTGLDRESTTTPPPTGNSGIPAPVTTPASGPPPPSVPFSLGEPAQLGDFDGRVIVEYAFGARGRSLSEATVGDSITIGVDIRNSTDHEVNMGTPAVLCATDLTADGHTNHSLDNYPYLWFLTLAPFAPGEQIHDFPRDSFDLGPGDVGTMTCEAVLFRGSGAQIATQRITRIAPVSFTVSPAPPTTEPPADPVSTSTTVAA